MIDPKALTWRDGGMAGIMLGEDAGTTVAILGAPWGTLTGGRTVPPQDGAAMARQGLPATWQYPAVGLTLEFTGGRVHQITVAAPHKGGTVRGLMIGEDMTDVITIFGEHGSVSTESEKGKQRSTYSFENANFTVMIAGDFDGKVQQVSVTAKKECMTKREGWCPPGY